MAAGAARKLHKVSKLPVLIVGTDGRPRWHEVWEGLPYILKRQGGRMVTRLLNGGGARPYIEKKTPERWFWKPYKPIPAEIQFTPAELAFAEPYRGMIMIEPNVKAIGHDNKAWIWDRWEQVADTIDLPVIQCIPSHGRALRSASLVSTPTFRHALAVLSVCRAYIGPEGGLHHGAAAVGTPAVILWSEFISPEITGYPTMMNLRHAGKPCGMRSNCPSCRRSMEAITVDEVITALEGILK